MRALLLVMVLCVAATADPMRPLPVPSKRAPSNGRSYFVHPTTGDDKADGSEKAPWRTIARAAGALKPGDTLVLRGGVYYERVSLSLAGTAAAPITIRSAPGELAVVDAGYREFADAPASAWEPVGTAGEYRSTKPYPELAPDERGVAVGGNFADSMVPLHGYRLAEDLRSANEYWNLVDKLAPEGGIYVGPGAWLDPKTHRIHARFAQSKLSDGYRGETDPRKLALVIASNRSALALAKASYVRIWDLVLRGSSGHTLHVEASDHVELDGLTVHGGSPALYVRSTGHLRLARSAIRGEAAPWSSRASMKYRGSSSYLIVAAHDLPQSHDWELAYNELTDSHDGMMLDSIKTLRFHHNRIDNFNDDALYLTFAPRPALPDDVQIYENHFSRMLTALSFAQDDPKPNAVGTGYYLYRNVFDLRAPTYSWPPKDAASPAQRQPSKLCGDHGSPTWDPMFFYNNTVITAEPAWREYYGAEMVRATRGSKRSVFDNLFVQLDGKPGLNFAPAGEGGEVRIDGNLLWSVKLGPKLGRDFLDGKKAAQSGWAAHDVVADPRFVDLAAGDLRLAPGSPAIDAGVPLPAGWPDSLRAADRGKPDLGALPAGAPMLRTGPAASP